MAVTMSEEKQDMHKDMSIIDVLNGQLEEESLKGGVIGELLLPQPSSDQNDPLNWSRSRKYFNFAIVCFYTIMTFSIQCITLPAWSVMAEELSWTFEQLNNGFAMGLATLGIGSMLFVPLAVNYGRRPIYLGTTVVCIAMTAWSAKMNTVTEFYIIQLIMCFACATAEAIVQITISDVFFVKERAKMNGIYLFALVVGNNLSQVAGGYITASQGWRWTYWWCLIFLVVLFCLVLFGYEETKHASQANIDAGETSYTTADLEEKPWIDSSIPKKTYKERLPWITRSIRTPPPVWKTAFNSLTMFYRFPAVAYVTILYGLGTTWINIAATVTAQMFALPPYNFSSISIGNFNFSIAIGALVSAIFGGYCCDWTVVYFSLKRPGSYRPEIRLYTAIFPLLVLTGSLLMYGISLAKGLSWIIPVVAQGLMMGGFVMSGDAVLTYLLDSYEEVIGEALIIVAIVRNILPMIFVFALQPWFDAVGLQNVFITCGCISILCVLATFPMIYFGERWRKVTRSKYLERYMFL